MECLTQCPLFLQFVLLTQLRSYHGMPTYWALLDLRWASDVAIISGMLTACYDASVHGTDWLLIDDIVRMDMQCLQLHGLLSAVFILGVGTAQGRSFSIHAFNAMLKRLGDEIEIAVPGGVRASLPPFVLRALELAAAGDPPSDFVAPPTGRAVSRPMADHVLRVAASESDPWPQTLTLIVRLLQNLPILADRLAFIEAVSSDSVSVVQYVDDTTAPCPSVGAVAAITRRDADSACRRYARWAKAAFNYGPSKTAVMALLGSPTLDAEEVGCDVVAQRRLLGCLIDDQLRFVPTKHWPAHGLSSLNSTTLLRQESSLCPRYASCLVYCTLHLC